MTRGQGAHPSSDPVAFDAALRQVHRIVEQLAQVEASAREALLPDAPDLARALSDGRRILEHLVTAYAAERGITFRYERLPADEVDSADQSGRMSHLDDEAVDDW